MLLISKKRHGIYIRDCWYAEEPIKEKGIIRYRYYVGENPSFPGVQDRTLLTDLTETEEEMDLNYVKGEGINCDVNVVLSNSLGFGGHNATLALKKYVD